VARPELDLPVVLADRYAIERELGRGGMATVYLARDLRHGRRVALKVLRPELSAVVGRERFAREIAIAARLSHPHILPLHDSGSLTVGAGPPVLFYAMPYVASGSLRGPTSSPLLPAVPTTPLARRRARPHIRSTFLSDI
jgi:serine/threonine protein kinase